MSQTPSACFRSTLGKRLLLSSVFVPWPNAAGGAMSRVNGMLRAQKKRRNATVQAWVELAEQRLSTLAMTEQFSISILLHQNETGQGIKEE